MVEENRMEIREGGKKLASYEIVADNVPATVTIFVPPGEVVPTYCLSLPKIGEGTKALLNETQDELTDKVPLEIEGVSDAKKIEAVKNEFYQEIVHALKRKLPKQSEKDIAILAGVLLHQMYGLGKIDVIMADDNLEEVTVNGAQFSLGVYHKKFGWCRTNVKLKNEDEIYNLSSQIGRKVNREINNLNPMMDAHLLSGDRVASTLFPISTAGNTITIRRFSRSPWTLVHLISPQYKTLSPEMAALLWLALQYELNVFVVGGTASGKTSLLSALCAFIPPKQRILSIEDTREVFLPDTLHWNWVPLTTRTANPEGKGEIAMLDLMISSLRMRPDRIVVGEVRRKEQAETMFEAMHTGHAVYTTFHADSVEQTRRRLLEPPIAIPLLQAESLQLIVVQFRDRRKGHRRTLEVAEVLSGNREKLGINYLYRWRPRTDTFEKANESIRLYEDLNLHTGMTPQEIEADLKEKELILKWMVKKDIKDVDKVGAVLRLYYGDKRTLLDIINSGKLPGGLFDA